MLSLKNKVALVTGGSRGIGAEISRRFAEAGAQVAFTYRENGDAAGRVVDDIEHLRSKAIAIQADASNPDAVADAVKKAVDRFGGLDILINNNGFADHRFPDLEHVPLDVIDRTININLRSAVLYARSSIPYLRNNGRIVNIGTSLLKRLPAPGLTLYAASKAGLLGLTQGLARDLGPRGITVNQISPGPIATDMNPEDGPAAAFQRSLTVFDRFGTPGEIAHLVMFLASADAAYITGADIPIDGGTTI